MIHAEPRLPPAYTGGVEIITGRVSKVLTQENRGTRVLVEDDGKEREVLVPTYKIAVGDEVRGSFRPHKGIYYPVEDDQVQVVHGEAGSFEREMSYAIQVAVPQIGQGRALRLARMKQGEAFDYLLGRKKLSELYLPAEHMAYKETREALQEWAWYFRSLEELTQLGLTPGEGSQALVHLGARAVDLARQDPYWLCQVPGVSYEALYRRLSRPSSLGKLLDRMKMHVEQTGNTLVSIKSLSLREAELAEALHAAGEEIYADGDWVTFHSLREQEIEILSALEEASPLRLAPPSADLTPEQASAWRLVEHRLGVLTGGPGTGKTYTVSRLVAAANRAGIPISLIAPTGKAARRMTELAGIPAYTIHGAIGLHPGSSFKFPRAFPHGLIIMDESSMTDLPTFSQVLAAVPSRSSLLLVGDVNQLPPVGPGSPFADLVDRAPTTRLSVVQRQGQDSYIVRTAYSLLKEEPLEFLLRERPSDTLYLHGREEELLGVLVKGVQHYLEAGYRPEEIQVLTPVHDGSLGTRNLNALLQKVFRPRTEGRFLELNGRRAYVGDKIIFSENRLQQGIANGTMGVIASIEEDRFNLSTQEGLMEGLPRALAITASLGYAITVHRSQGSEWPIVFLVLPQSILTRRKLVYTGLTRAKEQAVILSTLPLHKRPLPLEPRRKTYLDLYFSRKGNG